MDPVPRHYADTVSYVGWWGHTLQSHWAPWTLVDWNTLSEDVEENESSLRTEFAERPYMF